MHGCTTTIDFVRPSTLFYVERLEPSTLPKSCATDCRRIDYVTSDWRLHTYTLYKGVEVSQGGCFKAVCCGMIWLDDSVRIAQRALPMRNPGS